MQTASLILASVLALLVVPPLIVLAAGSLAEPGGGVGLGAFQALLSAPAAVQGLLNSLHFALASAALALALGACMAWLSERTDAPFRGLVRLSAVATLGTPGILYAGAWLILLGRGGPLNTWWRQLTGEPLLNAYSMPGMVVIEGLIWCPMVVLLAGAAFRNLNPALEDAARMAGATGSQVFRRITLRLALPALAALGLLVFIRALEAFEVPALLAIPGRIPMLTTGIYQTLHTMPPDLARASALSVVLLALVAGLLALYARLTQDATRFATVTGKGAYTGRTPLGAWRPVAGAAILLYVAVIIVLPTVALLWLSLLPFQQLPSAKAFASLTLANYAAVLHAPRTLSVLGNTLAVAAVSATVAMLLAAATAWLRVRKARGAALLDGLATLPLVFPGIVLAVALMQLVLHLPDPLYASLYGGLLVLAWAFTINALPYGVRYSHAGMLQLHPELEEAATMAGAGTVATLRRVVLPLLSPTLLAGWVFTALLATRLLSLPILLAGADAQTIAVEMFDLSTNGQGPELAALGLLWTGVSVVFALMTRQAAHDV